MLRQSPDDGDQLDLGLEGPVPHEYPLLVLAGECIAVVEEEMSRCHKETVTVVLHVDFAECLGYEFIVLILVDGLDYNPVLEQHPQFVLVDAHCEDVVLTVDADAGVQSELFDHHLGHHVTIGLAILPDGKDHTLVEPDGGELPVHRAETDLIPVGPGADGGYPAVLHGVHVV